MIFVHDPPGRRIEPDSGRTASGARRTRRRRSARSCAGCCRSRRPTRRSWWTRTCDRKGSRGRSSARLAACAAYYARRAAPWESQALLRAEFAVGDAELGAQFIALADRYRYPAGGLSDQAAREIRRIKARVEAERIPRGTDRALHLKLGPGGLSDVEWTVQLLQLQHGHAIDGLRTTRTLAALDAAVDAGLVEASDAAALRAAWRFAARIRNAIMLVRGRPGDSLPGQARRAHGGRPPARLQANRGGTRHAGHEHRGRAVPHSWSTPRRPPSRRTTAAPPDGPARSWTASSTANAMR